MLKTIEKEKLLDEEQMDAEMDRMKRLPRGSFKVKAGETALKNCKVKITMYLDADILTYFRDRAKQPNAAPYQTQINNELRGLMESGSADNSDVKEQLLNNRRFLQALKKKLDEI